MYKHICLNKINFILFIYKKNMMYSHLTFEHNEILHSELLAEIILML